MSPKNNPIHCVEIPGPPFAPKYESAPMSRETLESLVADQQTIQTMRDAANDQTLHAEDFDKLTDLISLVENDLMGR